MASTRSVGTVVATRWGDVTVEDLAAADPAGIDIALFSAGGSRSLEFAPRFAAGGTVVIDNSSAFRREPQIPLVVADVNDAAIEAHQGIVANPNCTTMALMMAVGPLHRTAGLERMVASSYQATSGSGQTGMTVLLDETQGFAAEPEALAEGTWTDPGNDLYSRPIGFNVLPLAGSITDRGYTDEEWKLVNETRHGIAATMWFTRPLVLAEARSALGMAPGVQLWDDEKVPTPLDSAGIDDVLVGRVRETLGQPGGISLWVVGDNLRKGAALNTVQLAELLLA
jgi:aspartate-semialdehyde dehydrogenase